MTTHINDAALTTAAPNTSPSTPIVKSILGAALMLPGIGHLHAQSMPEHASLNLSYLHYQESQSDLKRVSATAPSLQLILPVAGAWSLDATLTSDNVSGASPRYHSAVSGASRMSDQRKAADLALSHYVDNVSITVGLSYSKEHDYLSKAASLSAAINSADKNTTWNLGIGGSEDKIDPTNKIVRNAHKKTRNLMLGFSHIFTPIDIVQLNVSHGRGEGYYSDPYKFPDHRPSTRRQSSASLRWNHHVEPAASTLRLSYRYYQDSFAIKAHTYQAELEKEMRHGWSITPSLRFYTQSAASFYVDPIYDPELGAPFPPGYRFDRPQFTSADHRLSGFGAITLGAKVSKQLNDQWQMDFKIERYEQRGSWRAFHQGSPGLTPLIAHIFQFGLSKQW